MGESLVAQRRSTRMVKVLQMLIRRNMVSHDDDPVSRLGTLENSLLCEAIFAHCLHGIAKEAEICTGQQSFFPLLEPRAVRPGFVEIWYPTVQCLHTGSQSSCMAIRLLVTLM